MIIILLGGLMTEHELKALAESTRVSITTDNVLLVPSVAVRNMETGQTVHARVIGKKPKHRDHVLTEEGDWVPIASLTPLL
ncbi:MAG: hypothetical protein ABL917_00600 [Parcubacteria group bacterium]